jgi:hypothetical protein
MDLRDVPQIHLIFQKQSVENSANNQGIQKHFRFLCEHLKRVSAFLLERKCRLLEAYLDNQNHIEKCEKADFPWIGGSTIRRVASS